LDKERAAGAAFSYTMFARTKPCDGAGVFAHAASAIDGSTADASAS